jgi:parallel beta-helix repeat protein
MAACVALVLGVSACADSPVALEVNEVSASLAVVPTSGSVLISGLQVGSGRPYVVVPGGVASSARVYIDRAFTFQTLPAEVQGQTYIQTADVDQDVTRHPPFVRFRVDREAVVYVAYNSLAHFPGWLKDGFVNTGQRLTVNAGGQSRSYTLWSRTYSAAAEVHLGSNRPGDGTAYNYSVIIRAAAQPAPPASPDFAAVVRGVRPRGFGQGTYTLVQPASGRTVHWVSTSGNDNNAGTSAQPFRTINRAAQVAQAGDVVTIRAGTYRESVSVRNAGTAARPIVFQAEQRGQVVLTGGQHNFQPLGWTSGLMQNGPIHVTVRGLIFRAYATESPSGTRNQAAVGAIRGWRIEDCLFDRAGYHALDIRGDSVVVERSTFQYTHTNSIMAWSPDGTTLRGLVLRDAVLRGNNTRPDPIPVGPTNTRVVKYWGTTGTLVDNIESYENYGSGFWFDTNNVGYTIRNSYLHSNRGEAGRGLYIEVNGTPGGGLVENNVIANNEHVGITIANSHGVRVVGNLIVNNDRCMNLVNQNRREPARLKDVVLEGNFCKGWRVRSAIHRGGDIATTPALMNIRADRNTYDPGASNELTFWDHTGWIRTIEGMRTLLGWEQNGRIARIQWPVQ